MGEARLGLIDGVVSSVSGWLGKVEVVSVEYDPKIVSYEKLVKLAKSGDCATQAFPSDDAKTTVARAVYGDQALPFEGKVRVVKDTKYYLRKTPLRFVPMTRAQATRANADVKNARDGDLLSPSQKELLVFIEKHPDGGWVDVVDKNLLKSWKLVSARRTQLESVPDAR